MFLIMIPFIDGATIAAPIDHNVASIEVIVQTPANHNGTEVHVAPGVKLTMTDGFTVTMSQEDAVIVLAPSVETEEEYAARLCRQIQEVKPWIDWGCVN